MLNRELRKHVLKTLQSGLRFNNRGLEDYREVTVEFGVSKNAEGSARVTIGDTIVLAGVKMSLEKPFNDKPDEGILMVNTELTPMSAPDFEAGPPGDEAIEIARVVDRGIREAKTIDLKQMVIKAGEKVWGVSIDIVSVNEDGNLMDAAGLAAIAALSVTKFPSMENEKIDYKKITDKKLPVNELPIPVTVVKIGDKLLVDADTEEKEVIDARITITSIEDGQIVSMQKGGDAGFTLEELDLMLGLALRKAKELRAKLKK